MALFGNLFEKKYCSVCGNEIKLLGNRKLSDGNLCKDCANKLSPWFSERRQSTVEEIKQQLEYREANKEAVKSFNVTRTLGKATKVLLDEDNKKFIITHSNNWRNENPDILDYSQVTGCEMNVDENKSEIRRRLEDGKMESFNPRQYDYSYNIYLTVYVNHPYFQEMRFQVNNNSIGIKNPYVTEAMKNPPVHAPAPSQSQQAHAQQQRAGLNNQQQRPGVRSQATSQPQRPGVRPDMHDRMPRLQEFVPDPLNNIEYVNAVNLATEIKEILTQVRETVREEVIAASQPKKAVTCPYCGATTIPDANGCCEYCGGAVNQ